MYKGEIMQVTFRYHDAIEKSSEEIFKRCESFIKVLTWMVNLIFPFVVIFLLSFGFIANAHATEDQEKVYLLQLINQLDEMQPIILAAQQAQPVNQRVEFHYTAYVDAKGKKRNGLLEDVNAIKAGIEEHLNATSIEPRTFSPIQGDYIDPPKVIENISVASSNLSKQG